MIDPTSPTPAVGAKTPAEAAPGYKPSMIFTSRCARCGHLVRAFGYPAFNDACNQHFANCPAKKRSGL
jgi:hypothetical protein